MININDFIKWVEIHKYNIILSEDERGNVSSADFIRVKELYEYLDFMDTQPNK